MSHLQSYKIYINEVKVLLIDSADLHHYPAHDDTMVALYLSKVGRLFNYIDLCEKSPKITTLIIHYENFRELKKDFLSIFEINEAGGGLIRNEVGEYLFIFRRGFWDLPKGKIEDGETTKETAIREVIEETGLKEVEIVEKLAVTKHTFRNRLGKRIIKKSHWYLMVSKKQELIPQTSEDIEKAVWLTIETFRLDCHPVYANILDVLEALDESH